MYKDTSIIAEVKTSSPFGFSSDKSWDELFEIANEVGDILSIHTDARRGGSFELIREAKRRTTKPVLAKGIHATDEDVMQALDAGADFVLVVGRIPALHADRCLIEPNSLAELATLPSHLRAVWNSRDLSHGGLKTETFEQARAIFPGWLCQASNLTTIDDIKDGADAVLVGSNLIAFAKSLKQQSL